MQLQGNESSPGEVGRRGSLLIRLHSPLKSNTAASRADLVSKAEEFGKSLFDGNGEEIRPCFQSSVLFLSPSTECSFLNRLWLSFPECLGSSWPEVLSVLAEIRQEECVIAGERRRAGPRQVLWALPPRRRLCQLKEINRLQKT